MGNTIPPLNTRRAAQVPVWAHPIIETQERHHIRLTTLEETFNDLEEIKVILSKIWKAIKWGAPTVIGSAVTAGYINGDFATLLRAIFQ